MDIGGQVTDIKFLSHLQQALNASPVCVIIARAPEGSLIYSNKAVEKFLGHDLLDQPHINLHNYHKVWRAYSNAGVQLYGEDMPIGRAILQDEVIENQEIRVELDDGSHKWALMSAIPIKDETAKIIAAVSLWYDITEQKLLEEDLHRKASFDFLTGAYSRQKIVELAERSLARAVIDQSCLTFLLLDIDHFKQVNDQFGHPIGDDVLVKFVHLVLGNLRPGDLFGRYGGEEFLAVISTPPNQDGREVANKLLKKVEKTPIETDAGQINITVSIGVLVVNTKNESLSFDEIMSKADQVLYRAKKGGRNQICLAE